MKIIKIMMCTALILSSSVISLRGTEERAKLSILAGSNLHFQYGSEQEYELGINDFPVNPAHSTLNIGATFSIYFSRHFGAEIFGGYNSSSPVTLTDPSDQDTLTMNTSDHASISVNLIYRYPFKRIKPYLFAGVGVDKIYSKKQTYMTEYGYEVTIREVSENESVDPLLNLGGGLEFFFGKRLGLRFDLRYSYILDEKYQIPTLSILAGISIEL